ncbi:MAG: peptidyl-prolyl cis-trans isomerase [Polyangiaceae bacterium]|jgi:peptidyl-prolyl cis-trans isomerase C|nr:peptidyl-prolyl cis-trans isomerase [Polyangiaceae bacterium]
MMRLSVRVVAWLVGSLVTLGASAQTGPDDTVVARVGTVTITRGEMERRMRQIPRIQLATLGTSDAEIRKNFLERVLVQERLMSLGATDKKLADRPEVRLRLQETLRNATIQQLRKQAGEPKDISNEEVARYYEQNKERFQGVERIQLWRILVATKEEAQKILDEVRKPEGEARWKELAREKSLDKATHERGGDLGLVAPDGRSNEVTVKVDPGLYAAATKVKNGEIIPEPLPEEKQWAVVWRRGNLPPMSRPLELEAPSIRNLLARQRLEASVKETTERLRKDLVREVTYEGLGSIELSMAGQVTARKHYDVSRHKAAGKPQPAPGPGGLR